MSSSPKKDLTVSQVDRQNILNNPYAVKENENYRKEFTDALRDYVDVKAMK